jgi:coatomer protein complex subunit alpha (xenin)
VNWASFHPTLPLVISGADDRVIKMWRMNDTKAWEVDTLRGHKNNVSCVLFHPRMDTIISNSEDKSIRVWDISKRVAIKTFERAADRFWILAAHPTRNLLAAGHDGGMLVFKFERERPAFASFKGQTFYVKDNYLRMHHIHHKRDVPITSLRRGAGDGGSIEFGEGPRALQYNVLNQSETSILISSIFEGGSYELIHLHKDNVQMEPSRGLGRSVVFVARNRIAVLDRSRTTILIKNMNNEMTKQLPSPIPRPDGLFFAGTGRVLIAKDDRIFLFEINSCRLLADVQVGRVRYVFWNSEHSLVALVSKFGLTVCGKQLDVMCSVTETVRLKSGAFDENDIFIYTTSNHIKFCLPIGDNGLIRTLDAPVYICSVYRGTIYCLNRKRNAVSIEVDMAEARFKLALAQERYTDVMKMVKHSRLCGQAILSYLQKKGAPQVALYFVEDHQTRLNLALECGNIKVAVESATELDSAQSWDKLGVAALQHASRKWWKRLTSGVRILTGSRFTI